MATSSTFRVFWYLVFSIITGIAIFLRAAGVDKSKLLIKENIDYMFLIGTIIYTIFMHINSVLLLKAKTQEELRNQKKATNIFRDTIFKFLFSFIIGFIFIVRILNDFQNEFKSSPFKISGTLTNNTLYNIYLFYCLPIFYLLDLFLVDRKRKPSPTFDILTIIIVCVVNFLINFNSINPLPNIGSNISLFLYTFDAYIIYDFILFKINGGVAGFTLLYSA